MKKIYLLIVPFFVLLSCSQESDSSLPKSRVEIIKEIAEKHRARFEYYADCDMSEEDFQECLEMLENFYGEGLKED